MTRPRKERKPPGNWRTPDGRLPKDWGNVIANAKSANDLELWNDALEQQGMIDLRTGWLNHARVDPMHEDPYLAADLMQSLVNFPGKTEGYMKMMGEWFDTILGSAPDSAEALFARIIKLMRNREAPDRRGYARAAYHHYFADHGREPSKRALRVYMMERREIYKDQPGPDEPWTRLWKETGLFGMVDR